MVTFKISYYKHILTLMDFVVSLEIWSRDGEFDVHFLSPVENPMKHQFHPCFIYVGVCNYQALSSTWSGISRIFCYVYRKFWCILNKHWRGNTRDMYWHINEKKYWHIKLLMKKRKLIFDHLSTGYCTFICWTKPTVLYHT